MHEMAAGGEKEVLSEFKLGRYWYSSHMFEGDSTEMGDYSGYLGGKRLGVCGSSVSPRVTIITSTLFLYGYVR